MNDYLEELEKNNHSVPMFPGYISNNKPWRNLALGQVTDDEKFYLSQNVRGIVYVALYSSYEELITGLFASNLMLFVDNLETFPFLEETIADDHATVLCSKPKMTSSAPSVLSIRIKRKGESRWIVPIGVWGMPYEWRSIELLTVFYKFMNIGCYPTPGSLGMALMKDQWRRLNLPKHTVLNTRADNYIREHSVGGRCDTPALGQSFPVTLELDRSSSYLAEYEKHPAGTASWFKMGFSHGYATYFAKCHVSIPQYARLPLGSFPIKVQDNEWKYHLEYPTEPGNYEAFLWKEQVLECLGQGLSVTPQEGYGWFKFTHDNTPWAKYMYFLKQESLPELEGLVKQCIVKAIGRHAMENKLYVLIAEKDYQEGDIAIASGGKFYAFFIRERLDTNCTNMLHWNAYTVSMANLALFQFALSFAHDGRLLFTNYDSVMVIPREEDYTRYPRKEETKYEPVGTWGYKELHDVEITAPRSYKSREKNVQPGIERKK